MTVTLVQTDPSPFQKIVHSSPEFPVANGKEINPSEKPVSDNSVLRE